MWLPKSRDKQRECKPNDNKGKSEANVCERIKKYNKKRISGAGGGQLELNQCACPLCLINCLSGHHCRDYWSEKDKHASSGLGRQPLVASIDDVAIQSLFHYNPFTSWHNLFRWPLTILADASRVQKGWEAQGIASWVSSPPLPVMRLCVAVSHCVSQLTRLRQCACQTASVNKGVCHVG